MKQQIMPRQMRDGATRSRLMTLKQMEETPDGVPTRGEERELDRISTRIQRGEESTTLVVLID